MKKNIKCAFGFHEYEIYKEEPITDFRDNVVGKIIINRCVNCGKIKTTKIYTVENY